MGPDLYISQALLLAIAIGVYVFLEKRRISRLALKNREEWVRSYLKRHPQALPLQIIGAYNSYRRLGAHFT
jgi:hypothetical protein